LCRKSKFQFKIDIVVKNPNYVSEIKICMKNLFFLSKIEDSNWGQERKFIRKNGQKSKFRSKIEIEVKNRNLDQKSKFRSKIEI